MTCDLSKFCVIGLQDIGRCAEVRKQLASALRPDAGRQGQPQPGRERVVLKWGARHVCTLAASACLGVHHRGAHRNGFGGGHDQAIRNAIEQAKDDHLADGFIR